MREREREREQRTNKSNASEQAPVAEGRANVKRENEKRTKP
jgi:hypothetical protein